MNGIIELTLWQVAAAYIFVVVVLFIVRKRGIGREQEIVLATLRMTLQLVLVGYVLVLVFDNPHPAITLGIIVLMELFAIYTVIRKFRGYLSPYLQRVIALAMIAGTSVCLVFFLLVVIGVTPWYNPQYFIPIAGMFIGNSMTALSLGVKSLTENMESQRHLIEEALILGATPKNATGKIIDSTFDSAIMPTINSMLGMGIVFLPGMMTGQILAGVTPTTAIAYQIAMMLGILGAVALSVIIVLQMGYRSFFNEQAQLR
ncbi:conserved hypothetical protein [Dehalogenimonas lykanthroporepellens BL-DC-9]|nr:conserved hypothetical protein [Dehalogenimonas lykanthroporepellens BL-DC-9]